MKRNRLKAGRSADLADLKPIASCSPNAASRLIESVRRELYADFISKNSADQLRSFSKLQTSYLGRSRLFSTVICKPRQSVWDQFSVKNIADIRSLLGNSQSSIGTCCLSECPFSKFEVVSSNCVRSSVLLFSHALVIPSLPAL